MYLGRFQDGELYINLILIRLILSVSILLLGKTKGSANDSVCDSRFINLESLDYLY